MGKAKAKASTKKKKKTKKSTTKEKQPKTKSKARKSKKREVENRNGKPKSKPKPKSKSKRKSKTQKPTHSSHYILPPEVVSSSMFRVGNLLSWVPGHHLFEKHFLGVGPKSSKGPRQREYEQAKKENRQPHVIENARRLAKNEREGKSRSPKSRAGIVAGWSTRAPVSGKERNKMAQNFPQAFLVYEEKQTKRSQEIYHVPKFPIVSREALKTNEYIPDLGGLHAALRRYLQYKEKFGVTEIDHLIYNILKRQKQL